MVAWRHVDINLETGETVKAQAPIIVSASRSTDIPAFYADWFFHRLKMGYSVWTNPFNGKSSYISYQDTRFIVFWSKNPQPLLAHRDELKTPVINGSKMPAINCYVQFTLNDYEAEGLEKGVPSLAERIAVFKKLVDFLGKGNVIWRFDPLMLTDKIDISSLLKKIEHIGDRLNGYTEKMVFSFADISTYRRVKSNLEKNKINYKDWDALQMEAFTKQLVNLNQKWGFQLSTCGEQLDIEKYGVTHNRCIDDDLMIRIAHNDNALMKFLKVEVKMKENTLFGETEVPSSAIPLGNFRYAVKTKVNKDKGQRQFCGCIISKDIGEYNTCPHRCEYCYANANKEIAVANYTRHKNNKFGKKITG